MTFSPFFGLPPFPSARCISLSEKRGCGGRSALLEEQLDPELFFRVNRQMIVNIDAIDHASLFYKGKMKVKVRPVFKTDVVVSERKTAAFRLWLNY